jgi:hypothetical protein
MKTKKGKKTMSSYSIKDLEHLSGIKAHTLRIWEQRYDIINPKRTDTQYQGRMTTMTQNSHFFVERARTMYLKLANV